MEQQKEDTPQASRTIIVELQLNHKKFSIFQLANYRTVIVVICFLHMEIAYSLLCRRFYTILRKVIFVDAYPKQPAMESIRLVREVLSRAAPPSCLPSVR